MAHSRTRIERPLSPHLQIYRLTLTMLMSIAHRITGLALYFGMAVVAWWLASTAYAPSSYATFQTIWGSAIGRLILFGFSWAMFHHMLGGIRHLIWDLCYGFDPAEREWLARATLVGSIVLTLLLWIVIYFVKGLG